MRPKYRIGDPVWWIVKSPWVASVVESIEFAEEWFNVYTGEMYGPGYGYKLTPDPDGNDLPACEKSIIPRNPDQHRRCDEEFKKEFSNIMKNKVV